MPIRRSLMIFTIMIGVGAAASLVWNWGNRHHVATMLNIESLPQSVRAIDCVSFGFSDVLDRCSFEIEPDDFPELLSGYEFQMLQVCGTGQPSLCVEKAEAGMSHDYCCGPQTGENFHIAKSYVTTPRDAPHGGRLTVLTDASKRRAMVDLYVE